MASPKEDHPKGKDHVMSVSNKKRTIQPGDGDPRHGTSNGYNNLKCRCPECTTAWAVYFRPLHAKYMRNKRQKRDAA